MKEKLAVHDCWNDASCGEQLLLPSQDRDGYAHQAAERYRLEPYIEAFAEFARWRGRDVLEVGVGLGADYQRFADVGARVAGFDTTSRAVHLTWQRLQVLAMTSRLAIAGAWAIAMHQ